MRKAEIDELKLSGVKVKIKTPTQSNIDIAKEYATKVYDMTNPGGQWISTNLNQLSAGERYAVIKVYESIWDKVEVDADGGCLCTKAEA